MTTALMIVALALVVTKWLDCWTTLRGVSASAETNLLAARLMQKLGVRATVWIVFTLACSVILTGASIAHFSESPMLHMGYVLVGGVVSAIQLAVAHTNHTGRWNFVTQRVLRYHQIVAGLIQRGAPR